MIYQISSIQSKTQALAQINKGLIQARHIQARLKETGRLTLSDSSFRNTTAETRLMSANSWFD